MELLSTKEDSQPPGLLAQPRRGRNGAAALLKTLIECGVDTLFGYPGGAALPLYDALHGEPRLRHVLVRHEQAAVHAAEGYARSTGRAGVVIVTSGPGVGNTMTGLLDAKRGAVLWPAAGESRVDTICDVSYITVPGDTS